MSESRFGPDSGLDQEETSVSSDVRSGYDDDQPPLRVVEETSEDDVDSHAADVPLKATTTKIGKTATLSAEFTSGSVPKA